MLPLDIFIYGNSIFKTNQEAFMGFTKSMARIPLKSRQKYCSSRACKRVCYKIYHRRQGDAGSSNESDVSLLPTALSLPETHNSRETSSILGAVRSVRSIKCGFGSFEKNWHHNKNFKKIQRFTASTNHYESREARRQGWKSAVGLKL